MKSGLSLGINTTLTLLLLLGLAACGFAQSSDQSTQLDSKNVHIQATVHYDAAVGDISDNDPVAAVQELHTTLSIDPKYGDAWNLLGALLWDQHDIDGARSAWRNAIKYGESSVQNDARRALAHSDFQIRSSFYAALALFLVSFGWFYLRAPILVRRARALPDSRSVTPPLGGFNFGICWFAFFWGVANSVRGAVFSLVPVVGVPIQIYYGFVGQRAAWNGPREQTARDFALTQLAWARWATWKMVLIGALLLAYFNLLVTDPTTPYGLRGALILLGVAVALSAFPLLAKQLKANPSALR
jgi:hypothetical protein